MFNRRGRLFFGNRRAKREARTHVRVREHAPARRGRWGVGGWGLGDVGRWGVGGMGGAQSPRPIAHHRLARVRALRPAGRPARISRAASRGRCGNGPRRLGLEPDRAGDHGAARGLVDLPAVDGDGEGPALTTTSPGSTRPAPLVGLDLLTPERAPHISFVRAASAARHRRSSPCRGSP